MYSPSNPVTLMRQLNRRTYLLGAFWSSSVSLMSKTSAFLQQLVVAFMLGANIHTDIYYYLFALTLQVTSITQSLSTSVLVPHAMTLRSGNPEQEMRFHSTFLCLILWFVGFISVLALLMGERMACWLMNFPRSEVLQHMEMFYWFFPLVLLMILCYYLGEILVSFGYFMMSILTHLIINVSGILTLLILRPGDNLVCLMQSGCIAMSVFVMVQLWVLFRVVRWRFYLPDFSLVPKHLGSLSAIVAGQGMIVVVTMLPLYWLSQYGPGLVTLVNYAQKFVQSPLAIIQQVGSVLQVRLNQMVAHRDTIQALRNALLPTLRVLFLLALVSSTVIFLLRDFISHWLYGMGRLPSENQLLLSWLLGLMAFSMPFTAIATAWQRLYFACRRVWLYFYLMTAVNVLSLILYYVFIRAWVATGYAIVFLLVEAIIAFAMYMGQRTAFKQRLNGI